MTEIVLQKIYLNWSGGKDAALALNRLQESDTHLSLLVTAINEDEQAVSMHNVPVHLLEKQFASIQIPSKKIMLPAFPSMEKYESVYAEAMEELKQQGFTHAAFGDIFLEDLKDYREKQLQKNGLEGMFPLWKDNSSDLLKEFVAAGFRAIIICVNTEKLSEVFLGKFIDGSFAEQLPSSIDPCGENGEYHSFCFEGPVFSQPVEFTTGNIYYKDLPNPEADPAKPTIRFAFLEIE